MCGVCGCGQATVEGTPASGQAPHHHHHHDHHHHHHSHGARGTAGPLGAVHAPGLDPARIVRIEQDILGENDRLAARNRAWFADRAMRTLNLVSAPGSGKTTLLVRTLTALMARADAPPVAVIEGDQQTDLDAQRIRATGAPAVQINTGKGCHLDAGMVARAVADLDPARGTVLFIENVGNLVCPAAFDLGEAARVLVISVTEGEDKPLKYPDMVHAADLMLLNKIDLLPHVAFDVDRCVDLARRVKPGLPVLPVSATTGEGLDAWLDWILDHRPALAGAAADAGPA
ncbi:hydrogenase nickel incorporation protein HypB [Roseospira navarrensis]|uniref:Hydrogenase maturation factor HypB n=1 Tax=Roseospira navarrensis TaxID=140058 RepID=A0A7X1ZBX0_9PROT|nr:hydrogenase nickel incorporation protein HypB [Roseospira navarrensis]MQX35502.1 hydrogenase nickel incorporation protein HypB [Roseospira navarrensis]